MTLNALCRKYNNYCARTAACKQSYAVRAYYVRKNILIVFKVVYMLQF